MTIDAEPQKIGWLEYFVVMLILIFPMMRAFVPLEHYFSVIHDGNVKDALYAAPTNLTASSIENSHVCAAGAADHEALARDDGCRSSSLSCGGLPAPYGQSIRPTPCIAPSTWSLAWCLPCIWCSGFAGGT
jgi:hypothetical protein